MDNEMTGGCHLAARGFGRLPLKKLRNKKRMENCIRCYKKNNKLAEFKNLIICLLIKTDRARYFDLISNACSIKSHTLSPIPSGMK